MFKKVDLALAYEVYSQMRADIFRKAFTEVDKRSAACKLCVVVGPSEIRELVKFTVE